MNCWQTNKVALLVLLLMLWAGSGHAQSQSFVEYTGKQEIELPKGKEEKLKLRFVIKDDFYIQGNKLENEYFIPTELKIMPSEGIVVGDIQFPTPIQYHYGDENAVLDIYANAMVITVPITIIDSPANADDLKVQGSLYYQACSKIKCYYPRSLEFTVNIKAKSKQHGSDR